MAALATIQEYLDRARSLLQDTAEPYRYSDVDMVAALDMGILEARRIRPDLVRAFFRATDGMPEYSGQALSADVAIDQMYRVAFVYYIVGQMQLRDDEETTDARASVFMNKFVAQLLETRS